MVYIVLSYLHVSWEFKKLFTPFISFSPHDDSCSGSQSTVTRLLLTHWQKISLSSFYPLHPNYWDPSVTWKTTSPTQPGPAILPVFSLCLAGRVACHRDGVGLGQGKRKEELAVSIGTELRCHAFFEITSWVKSKAAGLKRRTKSSHYAWEGEDGSWIQKGWVPWKFGQATSSLTFSCLICRVGLRIPTSGVAGLLNETLPGLISLSLV